MNTCLTSNIVCKKKMYTPVGIPTGLRHRQNHRLRLGSGGRYPIPGYFTMISDGRLYPSRRTPIPAEPVTRSGNDRTSGFLNRIKIFSMMREHKFLMFFIISVICFAGVTWQLYKISDEYLKYPVVSEVYVMKLDEVVPPAFSLCFPWIEMLPWSKLNRTQDEWIALTSEERKTLSKQINDQYTVRMIFDQTYDMRNILLNSFVRKVGSFETENNTEHMSVEKFVKDDLICYKMMNADAVKKNFFYPSHQITYGMEPGMTLGVTLSKKMLRHVSKVVIFLVGRNRYPRGDGDFPVTYLSNNSQDNATVDASKSAGMFGNASMVGITYAKTTIKRLRPPYNMKCFPYRELKVGNRFFDSHYDWIHDCVNNSTLKLLHKGSFTSTFRKCGQIDFTLLSKYDVWDDTNLFEGQSMGKILDHIIDRCNRSSPGISCAAEFFTPQLISSRDSEEITFTLYDMSAPETQLIFRPLTSGMDLYVQVISVIGAWLGISCVDMVYNALTVITMSGRSCNRIMRRM